MELEDNSMDNCSIDHNGQVVDGENEGDQQNPEMPGLQGSDRFELYLDQFIGKGGFGEVYKGFDRLENKEIAVKCTRRGPHLASKLLQREILNQKILQHDHIVAIKGVFLTEEYLCVAMEFCEGGNMHDVIAKKGARSEAWAIWYFQQLVLALEFCHKKGVAIRDIKLEHLLLDKERKCLKLCDFGYSKSIGESEPHTRVGTPRYLAPEIKFRPYHATEAYDGEKVDTWCAGVCLYTMIYARYPEYKVTVEDILPLSQEQRWEYIRDEINIPEHQKKGGEKCKISPELLDILRQLLEPDPNRRIDVKGILHNPWFQTTLNPEAREWNTKCVKMSEVNILQDLKLQSDEEIKQLIQKAQDA